MLMMVPLHNCASGQAAVAVYLELSPAAGAILFFSELSTELSTELIQSDYRLSFLSIMETLASGPVKLPIYKPRYSQPLGGARLVAWSPSGVWATSSSWIIALRDDCIKTAFQNAFVDGKLSLDLFGNPENCAHFGVPEIPCWPFYPFATGQ